jgi:hypothetical protein
LGIEIDEEVVRHERKRNAITQRVLNRRAAEREARILREEETSARDLLIKADQHASQE